MIEQARSVSGRDSVFLGRGREIGKLKACLENVLAGQNAVVAIAGPAGIGKTRLSQEFAAIAERHGMTVLQSYCHEEPAAPAYWPWTRLMERYLDVAGQAALEALTAEDRAYLATLAIRFQVPEKDNAHPVSPPDPRQPRFRLFDAVSRLWQNVARATPLLLIIDDLHWCDVSSLKLLEFLVQDIETVPLMLVLTYRDDEVARRHPLSDTLGEIARRVSLHRLPLRGLAFGDSAQLIRTLSDGVATADWVAMLHERSEGNPFFLLELVRYLGQSDNVAGQKWAREAPTVPDGIRTIIGKRLNRLSPACERLLSVAAVVGRRFPPSLVAQLLETMTDEAIWDTLDEARAANVIEVVQNETDCQQFTHTLIRETLYDEMLSARRQHLHLRCGELLERLHGSANGAQLPQLAYHLACAAPLGDVERAVELAERAAQSASARLAYEEAARLYRLALDLVTAESERRGGSSDQAGRHHCELMLALGDSHLRAGEVLQALQIYRTASERAGGLGLAHIAAHAAIGFEEASWRPGLSGVAAVSLLERARVALGPPINENSALVVEVLSALSRAHGFCGNEAEADRLRAESIALARRHGDVHALTMALRVGVSDRWRPERLNERLRAAEEALALAETYGDTLQQTVDLLGWYLFDLFEIGDMDKIEHEMARYGRCVDKLREPFYRYVHDTIRAGLAFHRGQFVEFEALIESLHELGIRLQGHEAEGPYGLQMFSLQRELGQLAEFAPVIAHFVRSTPAAKTWRPGLALIYAEIGDIKAARDQFEVLAKGDFADLPHDGLRSCCLTFVAEVCVRLGDRARAGQLYRQLAPYTGHNIVVGAAELSFGSADRYLGMLAATEGRWRLAGRHFEAAVLENTRTGAAPWLARTNLCFARMLKQRGRAVDRDRALTLTNAALNGAVKLGMSMLERDALALREQLTSTHSRAPDALTRRELDVLHLLARGASNRSIGEQLCISTNTVANHVRNILAKTGSTNRTEAVAHAARDRLFGD